MEKTLKFVCKVVKIRKVRNKPWVDIVLQIVDQKEAE